MVSRRNKQLNIIMICTKPNTLNEYIDVLVNDLVKLVKIEFWWVYTLVLDNKLTFLLLCKNILRRGKLNKKVLELLKILKELLRTITIHGLLIICSDHGFIEAYKSLNMNIYFIRAKRFVENERSNCC